MKLVRLVAALAMAGSALSLVACGGGGDAVVQPEVLTAGFTLREGTAPVAISMEGNYTFTAFDALLASDQLTKNSNLDNIADTPGNQSFIGIDFPDSRQSKFAQVTVNASNQVVRVIVAKLTNPGPTATPMGCLTVTECAGVTVAISGNNVTVSARSVVLKALNSDWRTVDPAGGQVKASGIVTVVVPG